MKKCTKCGETKPLDMFTWDKAGGKSGRYKSSCKACGAAYRREYVKSNPDAQREYVLQMYYKISLAEYRAMLEAQGGVCKLCGEPETCIDKRYGKTLDLSVDHDRKCCPGRYSCGKCVRGLLCRNCNQVLGLIKENKSLLAKMIDYV